MKFASALVPPLTTPFPQYLYQIEYLLYFNYQGPLFNGNSYFLLQLRDSAAAHIFELVDEAVLFALKRCHNKRKPHISFPGIYDFLFIGILNLMTLVNSEDISTLPFSQRKRIISKARSKRIIR